MQLIAGEECFSASRYLRYTCQVQLTQLQQVYSVRTGELDTDSGGIPSSSMLTLLSHI